MALQVALKCADIGHLAASPEVHKRWALLLEEEFFLQVSTLQSGCELLQPDHGLGCPRTCINMTGTSWRDDLHSLGCFMAQSTMTVSQPEILQCRGTGRSSLGWLSAP